MTKSIPIKVEARMILNPVRDDRTVSVDKDYIAPNTVIELTNASISYMRNGIPTATVTVAMGRKNTSGSRLAVGHLQIRRIVRQVDVLIEAKLDGERSKGVNWPSDFFTVFDGFTSGVSLKRAEAEGSYQIQITHWLGHLLESSVLSDRLHPSAPAWAFTRFNNLVRRDDGGASNLLRRKRVSPQEISDDLWGKAVLPFLRSLAEDDQAFVTRLDLLGADIPEEAANRAAFKALKRILFYNFDEGLSQANTQKIFDIRADQIARRDRRRDELTEERATAFILDPEAETEQAPQPVRDDELPIVFTENEIRDQEFGSQIRAANDAREIPVVPLSLPKVNQSVRRILATLTIPCELKDLLIRSTHVNDTFWGRILRFAAAFQVSIVPAVNSAAIVPAMMHGTRAPRTIISVEEIFQVTGSGTTDRIPRGVILYSSATQSVHGQLGGGGRNPLSTRPPGQLGKYDLKKRLEKELIDRKDLNEPKNELLRKVLEANVQVAKQGMWLFRRAPRWLDYDSCLDKYRRHTIRRDGLGNTQFSWASGLERPLVAKDGKRINDEPAEILRKEVPAETQFIGDRFAQWMFLDEAFQSRVAMLNGRFRVDIMPGTTVQFSTMGVNITDLPFVNAYSGRLQGTVNQVTLTLDAENAVASTTLALSHLRNESEVASEAFSPVRHPVFNQAWLGGPLVPTFEGNRLLSLFNDSEPIPLEAQQRAKSQPIETDEKAQAAITEALEQLPKAILTPAEKAGIQEIPIEPRPQITEGLPLA